MSENQSNNKRIAKNTIYMYVRMGITMIVGVYTSRVLLQVLGVEDYGLYNVIGGVVTMLCLLNNAMANTTSRYITVRLAEGDDKKTRQIFNMAFLIHVWIAFIVLLLAETIGLWYIENQLVIPEGRGPAALWLYQLSILTAILSIFYVPFNATIIAHERMSTFAFIQIIDILLKLVIVIILQFSSSDKLILYGSLLACISLFDFFVYYGYCKKHFSETKFLLYWDKTIFREMLGFIGWAFVGNFSFLFYTQGLNLLLNAFCGPAVNAARGIAVQVEGVVRQFANNVQVAINPQIIKSYASKDLDRTYSLIFASSRYCFYLLFLLSLPILIETEFILKLWLGTVPGHTVNFMRIILSTTILDAFVNPMYTANLASGKLKIYHLTLSILMYSFMFVTYFAIKISLIPESVFISLALATLIGVVMRIFIIEKQIKLNKLLYLKRVICPVCVVVAVSIILPLVTHVIIYNETICFFITSFVAILSVALSVYFFGVDRSERLLFVNFIKSKFSN